MKPFLIGFCLFALCGCYQVPLKQHQPLYMRNTPTRFHAATINEQTGEIVVEAHHEDIDVSYDGDHWFHLLGDFCKTDNSRLSLQHQEK